MPRKISRRRWHCSEARSRMIQELAEQYPNDSEAWKIAGFAELNLKQYTDAAKDLEKAVALQRSSKQDDPRSRRAVPKRFRSLEDRGLCRVELEAVHRCRERSREGGGIAAKLEAG